MAFDWIKAKETLRESSAFASLEALAQTGAVSKGPGFLICADTQTKTAIIARAEKWGDRLSGAAGVGPVSLAAHVKGWSEDQAVRWVIQNVGSCLIARALGESLALEESVGHPAAGSVPPVRI